MSSTAQNHSNFCANINTRANTQTTTLSATEITQQWFANPVRLLAPMEGLTDPLMREILTQIGVDLANQQAENKQNTSTQDTSTQIKGYDWSVSEFIRVTQTVLPSHVFYKFVPELKTNSKTKAGTPIHIQLLGSDPTLMAENAVKACQLGSPAIDINFGCPAKTVNNHKGGSVLLTDPSLMRDIISAVRTSVPSHIPVSAKIRLGYENMDNMDDIRKAIGDSGANWLTIHARTKTQGYKPPAYWDKIVKFTDLTNTHNMPIIANGEIWTAEHANDCMVQAQTPHLMLGRGAVTRPDLIAKTYNPNSELSWQQLLPHQIKFLQGSAKSELALTGRYKQWLGMLTKGYAEAQPVWDSIKREKDLAKIIALLQSMQD